MDPVRLLEVRCHLRQKLVGTDTDVDSEAQPGSDFPAQGVGCCECLLLIHPAGHFDEALIDRELLQDR